jgi:hypothetical protein
MTEAGTQSRYALRGGEDAKHRLDLITGVLSCSTPPAAA